MDFDRNPILALLRSSADEFRELVEETSATQFHFKPGPDKWSIAETAEHVAVVEYGSGKLLRTKLCTAPAPEDLLALTVGAEERIAARLGRRDNPFPAPEFVLPKGRWGTAAEVLQAFGDPRTATIQFLETTTVDLRLHAAPHPAFGALNGWQWPLFLGVHLQRHNDQLREIRSSAGFPR